MRFTKAQVSLEYLVVLGFALLLLVPVVSLFQASSAQSEDLTNSNLIILAGRAFLSNAESVFYQGTNSRVKVEVFFPGNIENITIANIAGSGRSELTFSAVFNGLESDFVFFSPINLSFGTASSPCSGGSLPPDSFLDGGNKIIFIHSCGGNVSIYEFQD